ncbi:VanR-ABDEGLN family response regulator transcription factor [Enterococcus pallens]|uniref:Two-component system response regulator VanR n=1 Tax=Enterococcus pallens ATCC BAA-351 TaxID=1158607 RepID=R2SRW2_9ENTE|nr:VanR-ABDEGLN family response regulator transcription factor [Enterococcus pallens]EOH90849.1 hypothetical protein UAU_03388 [Enterococcus pallens ATCC BAA-351]EOU16045.1 hypothetical protein I588_03701 [Enterococcus pallens ATCC BAA-351]OJG77497.1 hypothetical protein RV10_GL002471 [Enterococcus pallens]
MAKVLLLDDEKEIIDLLSTLLTNEGYEVYKAMTGEESLAIVKETAIDLAILDVMLPDVSGFDVLQKIRETQFFPVLMLTARGADLDKISGLSMGADDYIVKPFNPFEVLARVKTQLRRYQTYNSDRQPATDEYERNGLAVSGNSRKVFLYDEEIKLTPIEFDILWYLCKNEGRVVPSEELFEQVWQEDYLENNNTVMAHVARIREKMHEKPRQPKFLKTVWGVGYTIEK